MGEMLLEWTGHDKAMSTKLWEFFKDDYLVDFSVTCHGQQLKVHKIVMAFLFPIVKESLRPSATSHLDQEENDLVTGESSVIPQAQCLNLDNIAYHAEDIGYLIQFAYTGKATVPKEHTDCLMHIADAMEVTNLKDSIRQWQNNKNTVAEEAERNDAKPLSRLRPRSQLKKVIGESEDTIDFDDDSEFHCSNEKLIDKDVKEKLATRAKHITRSRKGTAPKRRIAPSSKGESSGKAANKTNKDKPKDDGQAKLISNNVSHEDSVANDNDVEEEKEDDKDENRNQNLKCPHCEYATYRSYLLKSHLKTHCKSLPKCYTCKNCKKIFATKEMYVTHRDSKCCECNYCDFKSVHKRNLLLHMMARHRVDSEGNPLEKNIKCPECDFTCFAKHQLQCHIVTKHKRIDKFKCKDCTYTAPYMHTLNKHIRIMHQHLRDYMCEECGYRFQTSGSLNKHVISKHKGLKPYKCDICSAEYSHSFNLKIHKLKHSGEGAKNHVCHICGQGFFRRDHLRVHCASKHKVELPSGRLNFEFPKNTANETEVTKTIETDEAAVKDSLNYLINS